MPKGTIRNPGSIKTNSSRAIARVAAADKARSQRQAKAANEWDEYRSAGNATKSLRKTMTDVRSAKSAKRGMPTINKFRKDIKK
jgi:transglutaminase/protease-like cytokinesis protein 3